MDARLRGHDKIRIIQSFPKVKTKSGHGTQGCLYIWVSLKIRIFGRWQGAGARTTAWSECAPAIQTSPHLAAMDGGDVSLAGANRDRGGETRRYDPRDGGGRISSGMKSRTTHGAVVEKRTTAWMQEVLGHGWP
jgi:hypothetical protein